MVCYKGHYGLIDAGGGAADKETIYKFLKENVPGGKLDFVVFTHSDEDHIKAMTDTKGGLGKWLNEEGHSVGKLVDFDVNSDPTVADKDIRKAIGEKTGYKDEENGVQKMTELTSYRRTRGNFLAKGKISEYYTASQLQYKERGVELDDVLKASNLKGKTAKDLSSTFKLGDDKDAPTIEILNNRFGWDSSVKKDGKQVKLSPEAVRNNVSVCCGITYGEKKALFAGDLEEYSTQQNVRIYGETELIKNNPTFFDRPMEIYKASHHGSRSSSSPEFMDAVRPNYVVVQAVANGQYNFPAEKFVLNCFNWTDKIFVTNESKPNSEGKEDQEGKDKGHYLFVLQKEDKTCPYNVSSTGQMKDMSDYSAYTDKFFKNKRKSQLRIYNFQTDDKTRGSDTNCTFIKAGLSNTLIGVGSQTTQSTKNGRKLVDKIVYYCNNQKLDNLILPSQGGESTRFLGDLVKAVKEGKIKRIDKIFYCASNKSAENKQFLDLLSQFPEGTVGQIIPVKDKSLSYDLITGKEGKERGRLGLEILANPGNAQNAGDKVDKNTNSIVSRITFANSSFVDYGVRNDYGADESENRNVILDSNPQLEGAVSLVQMPANGMLMNRGATNEETGVDSMAMAVGGENGAFSKMAHPSSGLRLLCQGTFGKEDNIGSGEHGMFTTKTLLRGGMREAYVSHREDKDHPGSSRPATEGGNGDMVTQVTLEGVPEGKTIDDETFRISTRAGRQNEDQSVPHFDDNDNYIAGGNNDSYLATKANLGWLNNM